ncbi:unnamed protein product [Onchocerca flexuosa]|uniref:Uncharacterized protein n=1 Tax=Onchocerca flexuosa TaxID=387005 RepID=A0A183H3M6_9BILA|nr:unnamed protein product [Onchocerca flexuosa]
MELAEGRSRGGRDRDQFHQVRRSRKFNQTVVKAEKVLRRWWGCVKNAVTKSSVGSIARDCLSRIFS